MQSNTKLVNFIDLSMDEKKMILQWRNHSSIKQWMYDSSEILLKNHLKFIESLIGNKNKLYFLVKENNQAIGVIDFTNITTNSCEFGLYSSVDLKGYGKLLLSLVIDYAFNNLKVRKLIAEVFEENEKAIKLYETYNFIEKYSEEIKSKKVIRMELINENR
jgi:UDP-4-amino-4,6-dideoxy-N-acetyl-beta-L-altrosamine N-acetyltransferase